MGACSPLFGSNDYRVAVFGAFDHQIRVRQPSFYYFELDMQSGRVLYQLCLYCKQGEWYQQ